MVAIVEAINMVVGGPSSPPLSLGVAPGEIVGLLFPPAKPHEPFLRALAGLDATVGGQVRFPGRGRVMLATLGPPLSAALSSQPDLVLLDAADEEADRNTWALLASERALGTSFVVATTIVGQACRGDRLALASWEMNELGRAVEELTLQMAAQVPEFLAMLGETRRPRNGSLAPELLRMNAAARALLAEMQRRAHDTEEWMAYKTAVEQVAAEAVSDPVLEAFIAQEREG